MLQEEEGVRKDLDYDGKISSQPDEINNNDESLQKK
jgi:hypothetical protein